MNAMQINGWNLTVGKPCGGIVYLYNVFQGEQVFVARFKYAAPTANAKHFAKFLAANFTPAEYFEQYDARVAPLMILKIKGYVSLNEIKARKYAAELAAQQAASNAVFTA